MHDAGVRRHDLEIAERRLAPAQERIALGVAAELDRGVLRQRIGRAVLVDLHRVIDDQLGRRQRIDLVGIAAELDHRFAHRGEVDDGRHAGEVLHDHAAGRERDFVGGRGLRIPVEQRFDVRARDVHAVFEAQQVFQQDLQREGQAGDVAVFQRSEAEDFKVVAAASERRARLERVFHASSGRIGWGAAALRALAAPGGAASDEAAPRMVIASRPHITMINGPAQISRDYSGFERLQAVRSMTPPPRHSRPGKTPRTGPE